MTTRRNPATPVTKPGREGPLFRYATRYTGEDPGMPEMIWHTWAYNQEHAIDKFEESTLDQGGGWIPTHIARVIEGSAHRMKWHTI
jgi:hypothetical protein